MNFSPDEVRRLARLARIALSPSEVADSAEQLTKIFALVEQMQAVDTSAVAPLAHPLELTQRLREDKITERDQHDLHQRSAPLAEAGLYLVPKVIE